MPLIPSHRMKSKAGACLLVLSMSVPSSLWAGPGCLQVPSEVDFGPVAVGDTAVREAALRNACRHAVTVQSLAASPLAFGVSPAAPIRIPGSGSTTLSLRFSPPDTGAAPGQLRIVASDSRRERKIALKGTGVAASVRSGGLEVSPAFINESLPQGHSVGKEFTFTNHGTDTMQIYMRTWVDAPGRGGDSADGKVSIYFLSTMLADDIPNNFIDHLVGLPKVSKVTIRSGEVRTPPLSEILPYDIVIAVGYNPWHDADSAGNLLADYVDKGGTVILMHRALDTIASYGMALGGRITGPGYSPVARGKMNHGRDLITLYFIDDPLAQSVHWFQSFTIQEAYLQGKGRALGYYMGRYVAAAYNPDRPVYFINLNPYEPDYSGHNSLTQLILNIIDRKQGTRNWLRNPVPNNHDIFSLAPGEKREMTLPIGHAQPLPIGTHQGTVHIYTTWPQQVVIPATLEVRAP